MSQHPSSWVCVQQAAKGVGLKGGPVHDRQKEELAGMATFGSLRGSMPFPIPSTEHLPFHTLGFNSKPHLLLILV